MLIPSKSYMSNRINNLIETKKFLTEWIVFEYQSTKCFRANAKAQDPPNELTEEDYNNYYGEYEGEYGTDYEEGVDGDYGN